MRKNNVIIILSLSGAVLVSFVLSIFAIIFKVIGFVFLTILLGILTVLAFKQRRENKNANSHSTIDELLQNNSYHEEKEHKQSFVQKSEDFGNGLVPFALAFFTFCSFCVLILMLTK